MANVIKHKRGSGSDPSASDLILGELAIRTDTGKLFTKMDSGAIAEIAGGGSDIAINTLSSSSGTGGGSATFNGSAYRFTLSAPPNVSAAQLLVSINGVIQKPVAGTGQPSEGFSVDGTDIILGDAPAAGSDFFILTFKSLGVSEPADNSVTSAKIANGAIVDADINTSAAIAGSKISPIFTSTGVFRTSTEPQIVLQDSDSGNTGNAAETSIQYKDGGGTIQGQIGFHDVNSSNLFIDTLSTSQPINCRVGGSATQLLIDNAGIDVTGAITGTGDLTIDTNTLHVDSSNNRVGIGTTSPVAPFHVAHSGTSTAVGTNFISLRSGASGRDIGIQFSDSATSAYVGMLGGAIYFADSGSSEMARFDTSGRLLIGTTTKGISNGDDLTIATSGHTGLTIRSGTSNQGNIFFSDGTSGTDEYKGYLQYEHTTNALLFGTDATERMRIDSSGHVRFGSSGDGFDSAWNDATYGNTEVAIDGGGGYGALHFRGDGAGSTNTRFSMGAGDDKFYMAYDDVDGRHNIVVTGAGNVGIGTTSPESKFAIKGSSGSDDLFSISDIAVPTSGDEYGVAMIKSNAAAFMASITGYNSNSKGVRIYVNGGSAGRTSLKIDHASGTKFIVDGSGLVGIGHDTPSSFSSAANDLVIHGSNAGLTISTASDEAGSIFFADGTSTSGQGRIKYDHSGDFMHFFTANSDRMRIDSSGNVGINSDASGPDRLLHVSDTNNTSHVTPFRLTNTAGSPGTEVRMEFECGLDEVAYISAKNEGSDIGPLIFATASSQGAYPNEKARIRQNGAFGVGTNPNRVIHAVQSSSHGTVGVGAFENGDSGNNHAVMFFSTVRDGNAGESFLQCNRDQDNNGQGVSAVAFIRTNGDFDSATNSYGGTSDITLKENIVDAKSQWNDIKNIRVRNFNFKDNPDQKMLGVVAQEIETVCSGLVKETSDEGTTLKTVKYSILYMKAIKGLQEAMARIEALETKVAALEAK